MNDHSDPVSDHRDPVDDHRDATNTPTPADLPSRSRRFGRTTMTIALAGALAVGGGAAAHATSSPSASSSSPSASSSPAPSAPSGQAAADGEAPAAPPAPPAPGKGAAPAPAHGEAPAAPPAPPAPPAPGKGKKAHEPHIDGVVASVDDSTITVTDPDGFTRTIVTSDSTTYGEGPGPAVQKGAAVEEGAAVEKGAADGETGAADREGGPTTPDRSAVIVGAHVHAVGAVADDGTSLDASRVSVGGAGAGPMGGPADSVVGS